jgi:hypothetical protein
VALLAADSWLHRHIPVHEAMWPAAGKRLTSGPISAGTTSPADSTGPEMGTNSSIRLKKQAGAVLSTGIFPGSVPGAGSEKTSG